jgi:hypothetical protein
LSTFNSNPYIIYLIPTISPITFSCMGFHSCWPSVEPP